jgi:AcrR family transcriptional regulator
LRIYPQVDKLSIVGRPPASATQTATPERLLEAAEGVFSDVGFSEAKLADIAARAGITRPSLLYHFGTKEDLYTATVERAFGRLAVALAEAMHARSSFATRLRGTVVRYADFIASEPRIARIVLRELLDRTGPGARIIIERVAPLVSEVERFVREDGVGIVRKGLPVRAAILQLASDILLRAAAGPLREPLWGSEDHSETIARVLFLADG